MKKTPSCLSSSVERLADDPILIVIAEVVGYCSPVTVGKVMKEAFAEEERLGIVWPQEQGRLSEKRT